MQPLPIPLGAYFAAETTTHTEALAACFCADATVFDEGRRAAGIAAIKAWNAEAKAKYQYIAEPLGWAQDGSTVTVRVRLTGNFPGSPVELTYSFVLSNDKIASLEIHG